MEGQEPQQASRSRLPAIPVRIAQSPPSCGCWGIAVTTVHCAEQYTHTCLCARGPHAHTQQMYFPRGSHSSDTGSPLLVQSGTGQLQGVQGLGDMSQLQSSTGHDRLSCCPLGPIGSAWLALHLLGTSLSHVKLAWSATPSRSSDPTLGVYSTRIRSWHYLGDACLELHPSRVLWPETSVRPSPHLAEGLRTR